ncbi:MAG: methyltransferase, partial [Nitrospinae bacterium RIFCSPLOWO2_12_FULL_47_7]
FQEIIEKIDCLEESHILLTALELRVFTFLGKAYHTGEQVARKSKTKKEGMHALLNALVAMNVLRMRSGKYANSAETYKHLCESSKDYKKGIVMLRTENRKEWGRLLGTLRDGRDLSQYQGGDDPEFRKLFTHAMHERSELFAEQVSREVVRKPVRSLLDFGGGPGSYSAAILQRDKSACAVLLDRPATLAVAREIIRKMRLTGRFKFVDGDMFQIPFGNGFDTVLYSNILHIYNERQNEMLLRKIYRSMVKGGRLILVDYFLEDNRVKPYEAALFSLSMLLWTATGKTYTFSETESMLKHTGFGRFRRVVLGRGASLIEAIRV